MILNMFQPGLGHRMIPAAGWGGSQSIFKEAEQTHKQLPPITVAPINGCSRLLTDRLNDTFTPHAHSAFKKGHSTMDPLFVMTALEL
jgi:hypothetical protein